MDVIIKNRYKIIEKIKDKSKCSIYKGFDLIEKRDVAVKVLNQQKLSNFDLEKIKNEINIINKIDSPYSIKCYEIFQTQNEICIILEYCQENLLDKMKSLGNRSKIYYIKKIFNQLMEVYKKLHENNVIIRELKPEKILIKYNSDEETDFDIKISDYSFSKELSDEDQTKTIIGFSTYVAPEITKGAPYSNKCDLWSIGILGYILYFGGLPKFKNKYAYECDFHIPEDYNLEDLLKRLIIGNPVQRISWDEFFEHDFFKEKNFCDINDKDLEEVFQKYPKLDGLDNKFNGLEVEVYYDLNANFYGERIKGTNIFYGRGIYVNKELGILCKGYFFNGNLDGKGEMVLSDGSYYEGDFVNGYKFGEGKEIFPNGDEYEGEFVNHVFEGHGVLKYNNGNIYDGEFKCGRKDGEGKLFTKKNGTTYEGEWSNNLRNGKGIIYFKDGRKIEGTWKNGVKDGEFKKYKNKDVNEYIVEYFDNGIKKQQ